MDARTLQEIVEIQVERLSGGAPICATVFEGVVTLTGAVQNDMRRLMIEQELLRLPEVLDVHNHLHVPTHAGDLRTQLLALLEREGVAIAGVRIEAADGAVALSGQATSWFDRDAIERLAWTLPGVRSVENRVGLPPGAVEPDGEGVEISQV
ncbi:MAG: BON domain-containing protein [Phenylobacterium sp.]|uniref:BON domain-containing protein n=1 Tax=Phenylobacterium sp. TaxID=1871053 RepID=UPI001213B3A2|nr:BON domain-containing protein [Phenylobacterium sp.]TAJ69830.1 MAG: BON domain-containing protein [Phenylobacterium sp.]